MIIFEHKGYQAALEYAPKAGGYYGAACTVGGDGITFVGATIDIAHQEFIASVEDYLRWCAEDGCSPGTPRTAQDQPSLRRSQIVASLADREYRHLFVAAEIEVGLPFQIRALRQRAGWSQVDLAERLEMTEEGVRRLESTGYGRYSLATLKRLASVFDVALVVRFAPFSEVVDRVANLSPEDIEVADYEHDAGLVSSSRSAHGAVDGWLDIVAESGNIRSIIVEHGTNHVVHCFFPDSMMSDVIRLLTKRVLVEGMVSYQQGGVPVLIVNITSIRERSLDRPLTDFAGIAPTLAGGLTPEEHVDKMRGED